MKFDLFTQEFLDALNGSDEAAAFKAIERGANASQLADFCCTCCGGGVLHHSVDLNWLEISRWMLNGGVFPASTRTCGCTPLHLAAARVNYDMVKLLLQYDTDACQVECNSRTLGNPLAKLANGLEENPAADGLSVAGLLIDGGATLDVTQCGKFSAFTWAVFNRRFELAEYFQVRFPSYNIHSSGANDIWDQLVEYWNWRVKKIMSDPTASPVPPGRASSEVRMGHLKEVIASIVPDRLLPDQRSDGDFDAARLRDLSGADITFFSRLKLLFPPTAAEMQRTMERIKRFGGVSTPLGTQKEIDGLFKIPPPPDDKESA